MDDIDGVPLENEAPSGLGGFVKSKWEELDPEQVAHQAITTSKWELLQDPVAPEPPKISSICNYGGSDSESDDDSKDETEEKRKILREVEVKCVEYQDEIESGARQLKPGWSVKQQVEHYRRKLLKKVERNDSDSMSDRYQSSSSRREYEVSDRKSKKSKKSPSSERDRYQRGRRSLSKWVFIAIIVDSDLKFYLLQGIDEAALVAPTQTVHTRPRSDPDRHPQKSIHISRQNTASNLNKLGLIWL